MSAPQASGQHCAQLTPGLLAGYARGELEGAAAWSVEAHVPGCASCRDDLSRDVDAERLERVRSALLVQLALPGGGPLGRVLRRCHVPEHVAALLSATPSLRRSWLAGMALVLGAAIGWAQLAAWQPLSITPIPGRAGQAVLVQAGVSWVHLMPFFVIAPLLPLAAVAAAFSVRLDPAYELAVAAPVSGVWLLCVRAAAVISATLVPTALAALALPGPRWLPFAVLLPALAVCAVALAAATVVGPVAGAIGAGAAWVAASSAVAVAGHSPALVLGPAGQACAAAVLAGALVLLAVRRERLELSWARGADR
jgi:hypothetical protein